MNSLPDNRTSGKSGKIFKYLSMVMGLVYVCLGFALYSSGAILNIENWARMAISSILVLYGLWRFWRALKS